MILIVTFILPQFQTLFDQMDSLPGENFVKKFAVKFLDDPSFETLKKGLEEQYRRTVEGLRELQ